MKRIISLSLLAGLGLFGSLEAQAEVYYKTCTEGVSSLGSNDCAWIAQKSDEPLKEFATFAEGYENGYPMYVCRDPSSIPGKLVNTNCYVPWNYGEHGHPSYEVLTTQPGLFHWEHVTMPRPDFYGSTPNKKLVLSDVLHGVKNYICAVEDQHGNRMSGRLANGTCFYSYGGHEYGVNSAYDGLGRKVFVLYADI